MNKIILSLVLFLFSNDTFLYSQTGWFQQQSNTNVKLNKIYFLNSDIGWAVGNSGKILKTTNGGNEWISQQSNVNSNSDLRSVYFLNEFTGYVVGGSYYLFEDTSHVDILKTTNGGNNWFLLYHRLELSQSASDVCFINANTGYVVSFGGLLSESRGLIFKTINSGISWVRSEYHSYFETIKFTNENTGWIVSNYYSDVFRDSLILFKSTNSGNNWKSVFNMYQGFATSSFFLNMNTGWITGLDRNSGFNMDLILRTTNGGDNWENSNLSTLSFIQSISFPSHDTGWYCGFGIFKSTNSGTNWSIQVPYNGSDNYTSITFIDNSTGWAVGTNGQILKTVTGGITSVNHSNENIPYDFSLFQNYPNPFNPKTIINYQCSMLNFVSLKVYDVLGNEVATLVNENQNPGSYSVVWDAANHSSGIYFYKINAGEFSEVKKMTLLK